MYRSAWVPIMPWPCPNCGVRVGTGAPSQPEPRVGTIYTCPVCHLELAFNPTTKQMEPASPRLARSDPSKPRAERCLTNATADDSPRTLVWGKFLRGLGKITRPLFCEDRNGEVFAPASELLHRAPCPLVRIQCPALAVTRQMLRRRRIAPTSSAGLSALCVTSTGPSAFGASGMICLLADADGFVITTSFDSRRRPSSGHCRAHR